MIRSAKANKFVFIGDVLKPVTSGRKKNILGFLSRTRFPALINGDIAALRSDWFASYSASVVIEGLVSGFACFALTACVGLVFLIGSCNCVYLL